MPMNEDEESMTIEEHLDAAELLFPDLPRAGDVMFHYQQKLLESQRHLILAEIKMARTRLQ